MSLYQEIGIRDRRRKRRVWAGLFKASFYIGVLSVLGYYTYQLGWAKAEKQILVLESRIEGLSELNERLAVETEAAVTQRVQAVEAATRFQRQYEAEVPQGPAKEIVALVNERLAAGISPERLAYVVSVAENDERCNPETVSKRFILQTPLTTGANSSVSFANGTISVTGSGVSARTSAGPEARFDPTEPVKIVMTLIGGREIDLEGVLPIHHSVVIDDTAHRFTIQEGASAGFVSVTEKQCAYP